MTFESLVKTVFDEMKCKAEQDVLVQIPVRNDRSEMVAYLRPIIRDYRITTPGLPALLSQWRRENPTISTGNFPISDERTAKWLDNLVIGRADRLLFMVVGFENEPLGHIGFSSFNYQDESAEIDSVLRGNKSAIPGLMSFATKALMRWGFKTLRLKEITLSVYSDNEPAIRFYQRLGFYESEKRPLYKVIMADEEKYELAPPGYSGPVDKFYLKMIYNTKAPHAAALV